MKGTVHVVDDEEVIRDSLSWLLSSADLDCEVWPSGEALLTALPLVGPACIILDVRMEGLSGPDTFQRLIEAGCDAPVIFLTGHAEVPIAVEALKAGAFDFTEKPFNDNRLVELARKALDHHARLQTIAADHAMVRASLAALTQREREVLELLIAGQLNKQIAGQLDLAIRTVEVHRAHILEKFGVRSAVELAGLVARLGPRT